MTSPVAAIAANDAHIALYLIGNDVEVAVGNVADHFASFSCSLEQWREFAEATMKLVAARLDAAG